MNEETGRSMPAEPKPRKKPRQPDAGSDGAGVRRQKITETEGPVSEDSPEQGRKEQIHEQKFNQGLIFACVDYNDSDTGGLHRFGGGTRE